MPDVRIAENVNLIQHYCREAISHQLFVKNWLLCEALCDALQRPILGVKAGVPTTTVALIKDGTVPIGVCLIKDTIIHVYVKAKYRRQGLATRAVRDLMQHWNISNVYHLEGKPGSASFWKTLNIPQKKAVDYAR